MNEWYCQYEKSPNSSNDSLPHESAEVLYDIRNEYFNHGTFNVSKDYHDFKLDQFIFRIESRKPFNTYVGQSSIISGDDKSEIATLTINVRDFCGELINLGEKFYYDNKILFNEKDNIVIEDYDKALDEYNEFLVLNNNEINS